MPSPARIERLPSGRNHADVGGDQHQILESIGLDSVKRQLSRMGAV